MGTGVVYAPHEQHAPTRPGPVVVRLIKLIDKLSFQEYREGTFHGSMPAA